MSARPRRRPPMRIQRGGWPTGWPTFGACARCWPMLTCQPRCWLMFVGSSLWKRIHRSALRRSGGPATLGPRY
eukprot:2989874-Pyramimonas_sp.AAC.1